MRFSQLVSCLSTLSSFALVSAQSIAEINGNKFLSSYNNKDVANVTGLVTAKGPNGIWIRSTTPDSSPLTSESIYVFSNTFGKNLTTGDIISLDGRVTEYRSNPAYIYLTEITRPSNLRVVSRSNTYQPLVLGSSPALTPPTEQFTSLDKGDVFGLLNNASRISEVNPVLEPSKYGLDFWESLSGELVTVKKPRAITKPNQYGDTWVAGSWKITGENSRGGLTMTAKDSNPEAIIIGSPLDGTKNPTNTKLGDDLDEITGVVSYTFGYYYILPLTAIKITGSKSPALPDATKLNSIGVCAGITMGDYNIENFYPTVDHVSGIANHIAKFLRSPDIMFLQEVQDNNGPQNDDVVSANVTLSTLTAAIVQAGGVQYSYVTVDPVDDTNGGQPGGNIRNAYLWNPRNVRLAQGTPGTATQAEEVVPGFFGPKLKYNPGLIDPTNSAWTASRKPLVAQWEPVRGGSSFFTINVHQTSKGGSSSIEGDARPPVNGGIDQRLAQANVTSRFIRSILDKDFNAGIVVAGDFNEFAFAPPLKQFVADSGLKDIDDAANEKAVERYTYLFDMNSQQLDHLYISDKLARRIPQVEHVHVNTWVSFADAASDHDPSVARLNVC